MRGVRGDTQPSAGVTLRFPGTKPQMRTHKIAAIPGDGIGKEVVAAGIEVLLACAERDGKFALDITNFEWGSERYKEMGALMPEDGVEMLKTKFDAILFGAVGVPNVPDHITLWGLRLAICQSLDQYANVRPARVLDGIQSPLRAALAEDINWVIIRGFRGRVFGPGRTLASRICRGSCDGGCRFHACRYSKDHALCV